MSQKNLGRFYENKQQYDEAEKYYLLASNQSEDLVAQIRALENLVHIYEEQENLLAAASSSSSSSSASMQAEPKPADELPVEITPSEIRLQLKLLL